MSNFIKDFWDSQAITFGMSHSVSWKDIFMINLEVENISKLLKNHNNYVLDIGCANGYSTIKQLEKSCINKIVGVDFSEKMIEKARQRIEIENIENIDFIHGDILDLPFENNTFDAVYTTRVLINLPSWELQKKALDECIRVAKPNGLIIISEAFWEPLVHLNALRSIANLPSLTEHDFNRYIKKDKLDQYLRGKNLQFKTVEFSGLYYVGTRFLRELINNNQNQDYTNEFNKLFYEVENKYSVDKFGIQQIYYFEKK